MIHSSKLPLCTFAPTAGKGWFSGELDDTTKERDKWLTHMENIQSKCSFKNLNQIND